jgi:hypothetical protein
MVLFFVRRIRPAQRAGFTLDRIDEMQQRRTPTPAAPISLAARIPTAGQLRAVATAMQVLVEDDRARGVSPRWRFHCHACLHPRPAPGFVSYESRRFCNRCATTFEIARLAGLVDRADQLDGQGDLSAFVAELTGEVPLRPTG